MSAVLETVDIFCFWCKVGTNNLFMAKKIKKQKTLFVDIENTRTPEMRVKWKKILKSGENPFDLKYFHKWVEGKIIMRSRYWFVFINNYPYDDIEHQFVIVSKKFYTNVVQIPQGEFANLQIITKKLIAKYGIKGGGLSMRFGDTKLSSGTVMHIHAQLIVPKPGKKTAVWLGSDRK